MATMSPRTVRGESREMSHVPTYPPAKVPANSVNTAQSTRCPRTQALEFGQLQGEGHGHHGGKQDPESRAQVSAVDGDEEDTDEEEPAPSGVRVVDVGQASSDEW
jgi:hypothetical protein